MTKTEVALNDLTQSFAILEKRADNTDETLVEIKTALRHDFDELKVDHEKVKSQLIELIKQVTRVEEGLKHLEKDFDKVRSNRFEVGKVVLAAFFSFVGAGVFFFLKHVVPVVPKAEVTTSLQQD